MQDGFDFDAFLTSGASKLTRYCGAIAGSSDAEDIAQEAYVRLWQNLGRIPNEKAANAFLYRTAYRLAIDAIRARKRFREPETPTRLSDALSEPIERAMMQLDPADRGILYSRIVDECGYDEIAARFSKNEAWARKRFSLSKKKLRQLLGKDEQDE